MSCLIFFWSNYSDLTGPGPLKGSKLERNPFISGKSRLVRYCNLARFFGHPKGFPLFRSKVFLEDHDGIFHMAVVRYVGLRGWRSAQTFGGFASEYPKEPRLVM